MNGLDGIEGRVLKLGLDEESGNAANIRHFGSKVEVVDTASILVRALVHIVTRVVEELDDDRVNLLDRVRPLDALGVHEASNAVEHTGGSIGERIDTLRTSTTFSDVDSQERLAHVVVDECTQLFNSLARNRLAVNNTERTEVLLALAQILVRLSPQRLHDERIGSDGKSHSNEVAVGDGADDIGNRRNRDELNTLIRVLRVEDAGISSNRHERTLFNNLLPVRSSGRDIDADQNTDIITSRNSMGRQFRNKVTNHLCIGNDRELDSCHAVDGHRSSGIGEHLEEVGDECCHLLNAGVVELGDDNGLLDIDGTVGGFNLRLHIIHPHGSRSVVDAGVALIKQKIDSVMRSLMDGAHGFNLIGAEALEGDSFLGIGEDALELIDVVASVFTETAGGTHVGHELKKSHSLFRAAGSDFGSGTKRSLIDDRSHFFGGGGDVRCVWHFDFA